MKRLHSLGLVLAAAGALGALGCGDDSGATCGAGTTEKDGTCTATTITCTGGTELNSAGTSCVPSSSVCPDGTVLVGAMCQDEVPGMADLNEAPEPNGLGVGGETSAAGAGVIALKPVGQTLVVKGILNPFADNDGDGQSDPDFDTFTFHADGPQVLEISADGTHGIAAAFLVQLPLDAAANNPLKAYQRYGISVQTDTSHRQLYIPAAGDYTLTVGDVRSMYLDNASPLAAGAGGAAGSATAAYYLSITARAIPAATPITVTAGAGSVMGTLAATDAPKLYTVANGAGFNDVALDAPALALGGAFVVTDAATIRATAVEVLPDPATARVLGGTMDTIVVDPIYNYAPTPADFTLSFKAGTVGMLSTTGGSVTQPASQMDFSLFTFDVAARDDIEAFDIDFGQTVSGVLVTKDLAIVSPFSYVPGAGFQGPTFDTFQGLIRFAEAGKLYFLVFADAQNATSITAISTIAKITPGTVVKGTPLTAQPVNQIAHTATFNYAPGAATDLWQTFNVAGSSTGPTRASFFDPATAYGTLSARLDGAVVAADAVPAFAKAYQPAGADKGQLLLGTVPATYLVNIDTSTQSAGATVSLDFKRRAFTDLMTLANGAMSTNATETIAANAGPKYYLIKLTPTSIANFTVTPAAGSDVRIEVLNADDTINATFNGATPVSNDVGAAAAGADGYVAFRIVPVSAAAPQAYSLVINAVMATVYTAAASTTAFVDACTGGTTVTFTAKPGGPANDEGLSAQIASPAGFKFYGATAGTFTISTNGFLSFANPTGSAFFANETIPTAAAPNGLVAPYWDDLKGVTVCTRTVGTRQTIQWSGVIFGTMTTVVAQAILDGSNNTIEFVYGPQTALGGAATIGVEDPSGSAGTLVSFNTAFTGSIPAKKFTPN